MEEAQALELIQELGVDCEIGSETYEAMLQHPTVDAYVNGEITLSEAIFVEEYLSNGFNATKAAKAAKYKAMTRGGFSTIGSAVLKRPKIKALVARRISERAMRADEVLDRYREVADASMEDYLTIGEVEAGAATFNVTGIDLGKAQELNRLHLLKEVKIGKDGDVHIKLRDQDHALDQLARSLGVFEKDNTVHLPPEVLALLSLSPKELADRNQAYDSMEEWDGNYFPEQSGDSESTDEES